MNKTKYDREFFVQKGKKGGDTTFKLYGKERMKELSKLALEKRWGKIKEPEKQIL